MNCPKCGKEAEGNQKFCTNCGAEFENTDTNFSKRFDIKDFIKSKTIIIGIVTLFLFVVIGVSVFAITNPNINIITNNSNIDLYKIYANNQYYFIDKQGNEQLTIPYDENILLGEFREGRLFIAKAIKEIQVLGADYRLAEISIVDENNNVIKTFDKKAVVLAADYETSASYLPEFYNAYALIHFIDEKDIPSGVIDDIRKLPIKDIYINKNGKITKKVPENIKKMLNDEYFTVKRFETNELNYKEMPCLDNKNETCIGYTDANNNIKIKPYFALHGCGDWYGRNPRFINGIALVETQSGYFKHIDINGNFVFNEDYDVIYPFYGELAYVRNGALKGFINKSGKLVWSIKEEQYVPSEDYAHKKEIKYIYDVASKKWLQPEKNKPIVKLGNYIYLADDKDGDFKLELNIFGKYLNYLFNESEANTFRNEDLYFMIGHAELKNGRLFHFNFETLKLYEVVYNEKNEKLKLVEVTDHKVINDYYSGRKVIYISQFKPTEGNSMSIDVQSTYPNKFTIYNDVKEPWLSFYRHYFSGNNNDFQYDMDGLVIKNPTTLYYQPEFIDETSYILEINFK